ncbi:MAG: alcohol dehydrogenase catalytic domain-containing protein [Solidesulfovibrio sp.]
MQAVTFVDGTVRMTTKTLPPLEPGEVLIQVRMAGICNTDLELLKGYMGFSGIPGHEFVGRVIKAPDAPEFLDKRVTAEINLGCGVCPTCLKYDARHCPNRTTLGIAGKDGAFAEYCILPATALHTIPDDVSDSEAVFIEPLAAALEPGQQLHLTARQSVLVLGDGKLGILSACGLRYLSPGLVLAGRHARKLAIAAAQGVTTRQGTNPKDMVAALREEFGHFDVVIEATGRPEGLANALELVRPEGTVVLKTTTFAPTPINMAKVVVDEITLVGSRCGDFKLAGAYLRDRLVDVMPLIDATYPFEAFPEALAAASRPGAMKVLVEFARA